MKEKGIALVTGANSGIGLSIAKGLAEDGYKVILAARNEERLNAAVTEISNIVPSELCPEYFSLDITDHTTLKNSIKEIENKNKKFSVLVNNAGLWLDGTLGASVDDLRALLEVNLVAPFVLTKLVADQMKEQGEGYIFNIASRAGIYGFAGGGIYSTSKFGLVGLSESLYREYTEFGVKVTSICPAWVNTEMAQEAGTPFRDDEMVQPSDILNSIRYVLSLSKSACIKELVVECTKSVL